MTTGQPASPPEPVLTEPAPQHRSDATVRRRSRSAVARSAGGDRTLVVLVGMVLLAGGVLVALLSFGVFGSARAGRPLLDPMIVDWMRAQPLAARLIAIGAGVALAVLGLVSVARSVRPEVRPVIHVAGRGDTEIVVTSGAMGEAVAAQALTLPGVGKARARVVGSDRAPAVRITLWLADDSRVADVLEALETQVLAQARASLGLTELPVAVRLELDNPPRPPRVT
ncbi:MAG: alkaline shock response membrane anchor protein AmaP [Pseudonocardia sp.]|nr:alkaline shock response membrane anchor protein AmaP [Pseudonocardia sp.]